MNKKSVNIIFLATVKSLLSPLYYQWPSLFLWEDKTNKIFRQGFIFPELVTSSWTPVYGIMLEVVRPTHGICGSQNILHLIGIRTIKCHFVYFPGNWIFKLTDRIIWLICQFWFCHVMILSALNPSLQVSTQFFFLLFFICCCISQVSI